MPEWSREQIAAQTRAWAPEPVIPPFPGATIYGQIRSDNPDAALQIPAVWACVRLKADAVASMTLHRYRRNPAGIPVEIDPGPLLTNPSASRLLPDWLFDNVTSGELRGNVFGEMVDLDGEGRPTQIELVNPDAVRVDLDDRGRTRYRFGDRVVPTERVWHVRNFTFPGALTGLSTIAYGANALGLAAEAERFGLGFFRDGAHPSAILVSDHAIDQAAASTIKERFRAAANGREPVAMGLGVKYQQIQISPEESQFLETQRFTVDEIARLFGVPATMIGGTAGGGLTYANVEQRSLDFLTYAVQPWLRRLEVAVSALLPPGEFVRFDTSTLLRTDAETRAKVDAIMVASRTRVPSEIRHRDGLPPFTPEQLAEADLVPLEVTPTGAVKLKPPALPAPGDSPGDAGSAAMAEAGTAGRGVNLDLHIHEGAITANVSSPELRLEPHIEVHPAPPAVVPAPVVEFHEGRTTVYSPVTIEAPMAPLEVEPRRTVRTVERDSEDNIVRIVEETG